MTRGCIPGTHRALEDARILVVDDQLAGTLLRILLMAGYTLAATVVTTYEPGFANASVWLLVIEGWIAGRTLYDRDINGTDRRGTSEAPRETDA